MQISSLNAGTITSIEPNCWLGFMRLRRVSYPFSALMSIISVLMFLAWGLNFGIDFAGGTLLEVRAKSGNADLTQLRGLGDRFALGEVEVQAFGGNADATVRIRLQPGGDAAQQAADMGSAQYSVVRHRGLT